MSSDDEKVDFGELERVQVGTDADGEPLYQTRYKRPPTHTGGYNADGTLTKAMKPSGGRVSHSYGWPGRSYR